MYRRCTLSHVFGLLLSLYFLCNYVLNRGSLVILELGEDPEYCTYGNGESDHLCERTRLQYLLYTKLDDLGKTLVHVDENVATPSWRRMLLAIEFIRTAYAYEFISHSLRKRIADSFFHHLHVLKGVRVLGFLSFNIVVRWAHGFLMLFLAIVLWKRSMYLLHSRSLLLSLYKKSKGFYHSSPPASSSPPPCLSPKVSPLNEHSLLLQKHTQTGCALMHLPSELLYQILLYLPKESREQISNSSQFFLQLFNPPCKVVHGFRERECANLSVKRTLLSLSSVHHPEAYTTTLRRKILGFDLPINVVSLSVPPLMPSVSKIFANLHILTRIFPLFARLTGFLRNLSRIENQRNIRNYCSTSVYRSYSNYFSPLTGRQISLLEQGDCDVGKALQCETSVLQMLELLDHRRSDGKSTEKNEYKAPSASFIREKAPQYDVSAYFTESSPDLKGESRELTYSQGGDVEKRMGDWSGHQLVSDDDEASLHSAFEERQHSSFEEENAEIKGNAQEVSPRGEEGEDKQWHEAENEEAETLVLRVSPMKIAPPMEARKESGDAIDDLGDASCVSTLPSGQIVIVSSGQLLLETMDSMTARLQPLQQTRIEMFSVPHQENFKTLKFYPITVSVSNDSTLARTVQLSSTPPLPLPRTRQLRGSIPIAAPSWPHSLLRLPLDDTGALPRRILVHRTPLPDSRNYLSRKCSVISTHVSNYCQEKKRQYEEKSSRIASPLLGPALPEQGERATISERRERNSRFSSSFSDRRERASILSSPRYSKKNKRSSSLSPSLMYIDYSPPASKSLIQLLYKHFRPTSQRFPLYHTPQGKISIQSIATFSQRGGGIAALSTDGHVLMSVSPFDSWLLLEPWRLMDPEKVFSGEDLDPFGTEGSILSTDDLEDDIDDDEDEMDDEEEVTDFSLITTAATPLLFMLDTFVDIVLQLHRIALVITAFIRSLLRRNPPAALIHPGVPAEASSTRSHSQPLDPQCQYYFSDESLNNYIRIKNLYISESLWGHTLILLTSKGGILQIVDPLLPLGRRETAGGIVGGAPYWTNEISGYQMAVEGLRTGVKSIAVSHGGGDVGNPREAFIPSSIDGPVHMAVKENGEAVFFGDASREICGAIQLESEYIVEGEVSSIYLPMARDVSNTRLVDFGSWLLGLSKDETSPYLVKGGFPTLPLLSSLPCPREMLSNAITVTSSVASSAKYDEIKIVDFSSTSGAKLSIVDNHLFSHAGCLKQSTSGHSLPSPSHLAKQQSTSDIYEEEGGEEETEAVLASGRQRNKGNGLLLDETESVDDIEARESLGGTIEEDANSVLHQFKTSALQFVGKRIKQKKTEKIKEAAMRFFGYGIREAETVQRVDPRAEICNNACFLVILRNGQVVQIGGSLNTKKNSLLPVRGPCTLRIRRRVPLTSTAYNTHDTHMTLEQEGSERTMQKVEEPYAVIRDDIQVKAISVGVVTFDDKILGVRALTSELKRLLSTEEHRKTEITFTPPRSTHPMILSSEGQIYTLTSSTGNMGSPLLPLNLSANDKKPLFKAIGTHKNILWAQDTDKNIWLAHSYNGGILQDSYAPEHNNSLIYLPSTLHPVILAAKPDTEEIERSLLFRFLSLFKKISCKEVPAIKGTSHSQLVSRQSLHEEMKSGVGHSPPSFFSIALFSVLFFFLLKAVLEVREWTKIDFGRILDQLEKTSRWPFATNTVGYIRVFFAMLSTMDSFMIPLRLLPELNMSLYNRELYLWKQQFAMTICIGFFLSLVFDLVSVVGRWKARKEGKILVQRKRPFASVVLLTDSPLFWETWLIWYVWPLILMPFSYLPQYLLPFWTSFL